ncbi:MAG TPA: hypothetical protein PK367_02775 [Candidatus Paceibacterota bacterium]|nr:hypothetical protein [Candidatus Paceibacterota bacterium]
MAKPKILILEDSRELQASFYDALEGYGFELLQAFHIQDAIVMFDANLDVALIATDACIEKGEVLDAKKFITHVVRRGYTGPFVAMSSEVNFLRKLMEMGCNVECLNKSGLPRIIRKTLTRS